MLGQDPEVHICAIHCRNIKEYAGCCNAADFKVHRQELEKCTCAICLNSQNMLMLRCMRRSWKSTHVLSAPHLATHRLAAPVSAREALQDLPMPLAPARDGRGALTFPVRCPLSSAAISFQQYMSDLFSYLLYNAQKQARPHVPCSHGYDSCPAGSMRAGQSPRP